VRVSSDSHPSLGQQSKFGHKRCLLHDSDEANTVLGNKPQLMLVATERTVKSKAQVWKSCLSSLSLSWCLMTPLPLSPPLSLPSGDQEYAGVIEVTVVSQWFGRFGIHSSPRSGLWSTIPLACLERCLSSHVSLIGDDEARSKGTETSAPSFLFTSSED
jgi:hypothetical protein